MTRSILIMLMVAASAAAQYKTENVILVTADGLRWQDVFHGMDPQLEKLTALRRPPFNSFRSMTILSRPKLKLTPGKDALVSLPNGRRMKLTLLRVMPDGRYKVKAAINRPDKSDYLPLLQVVASAGDPFFVAGQTYQGGTLVVGVIVDPKKTAR